MFTRGYVRRAGPCNLVNISSAHEEHRSKDAGVQKPGVKRQERDMQGHLPVGPRNVRNLAGQA